MIKLKSLLEQEQKIKCERCGHTWKKSEGGSDTYVCHLCGYEYNSKSLEEFIEFCKKRLEGAKKIVDNAKEKGGPALLTYNHFVVKLPYYQNGIDGMFDCKMAETEYTNYLNTLCGITEADGFEQIEFQKLVGLIEVLGELIIKYKQK